MKIKVLSLLVAATAALSGTSNAVTLALSGVINTTVGLVTVNGAAVSGTATFVSTTDALTNVSASLNTLLASPTSTLAQFNTTLATLIGTTSPTTDPGVVRTAAFTGGAMTSTGNTELGSIGNLTYLFLVSEANGFITGIGAYTGSAVPAAGSVTFNPAFSNDGLVGTSVFAAGTPNSGFQLVAAVPEPSAALLGAIGVLGLLRRRRN